MNPNLVTLAVPFVLVLLPSIALAQSPTKSAPSAPKPSSSAPSRDAPTQESPRAMLERAAFLEEHERDFEGAAKLYVQAAAAAQSAGDVSTASEARTGQERVLTRLGKEPAVIDRKIPPPAEDAITNRIHQLFFELSSNEQTARHPQILSDLKQFGDKVVPLAEESLSGQVNLGRFGSVMIASSSAAELLSQLDVPAASGALARALQSPDPVVRRTVVRHMNRDRHRALIEQAAVDPVESVREAAIDQLIALSDPELLKIMEPAAKGKMRRAVEWMARQAPQRLIDLAFGPDSDDNLKFMAVGYLREVPGVPLNQALVESMLALARSDVKEIRHNMPWSIATLLDRSSRDVSQPFRKEIENSVLEHFSQYAFPQVLALLREVGGIGSIDMVTKTMAENLEAFSIRDADGTNGEGWTEAVARRLTVADFDRLVACFAQLQRPTDPQKAVEHFDALSNSLVSALAAVARQRPPARSVAAGYQSLSEPQRKVFMTVVEAWLDASSDRATGSFPASAVDSVMKPVVVDALGGGLSARPSLLRYAQALGDVSLLPLVLRVERERPQARDIAQPVVNSLASKDPEGARKAVADAIVAGWSEPFSASRTLTADLGFLPSPDAFAVFERLWLRATPEAKHDLLATLLEKVGGTDATAALFKHYAEIDQEALRQHAIERFGNELYEPAVPLLGDALKSQNASMRAAAQTAFKAFKQHREALEEFSAWMNADKDARASVAELSKLLESTNRDVVLGAVRALAAIKARAALPTLVKLLDRQDPELKKAVEDAIEKIGGS
jgi:tetratricopeptide (TPR) repeat protein